MSKKDDYEKQILSLLRVQGRIGIDKICKTLDVSEATARRYLSTMEEHGCLIRIHGGAMLNGQGGPYSFSRESSLMALEKIAIAHHAAELVKDGDTMFMDTGTTLSAFGDALLLRLTAGTLHDIRIVTNSLAYSDSLAGACCVTLTGGRMRPERRDLAGSLAVRFLSDYRFDLAVLGADGIGPNGDLFTTDEETAEFARKAMENSQSVLILADSSKLGRTSFIAYASLLSPKTTLVTDDKTAPPFVTALKGKGASITVLPLAASGTHSHE